MTISNPPKGDADKKIGAYFAPLSVTAQNTPNMTVKVRAGWFYDTNNNAVEYPGGNSPVIAAPGSNAKWVIVGINASGSIVLVDGTPAVTPSLPSLPASTLPLAFAYVTSSTTVITNDKLFDARPLFRNVDLVGALANYTTFADVAAEVATKADVDGTASTDFALNKGAVSGATSTFSVERGGSPTVALRWNEGTGKWQFTNDGVIYADIASVAGVFMDLVTAPTAGHVLTTDALGQAVDSGTALAALATTVSLAAKADKVVPSAAGNIALLDVSGNLADSATLLSTLATTAALALKADDSAVVHNTGVETIAGAKTFSSNVTINDGPVGTPTMVFGNFSGDMGMEVTRAAFPAAPALLKWDETSVTWQVGVVGGPMDSILTSSVVTNKVDRTDTLQLTGEVTLGPSALTGPANSFAASLSTTGVGAAAYGDGANVATFTVDTKGRLTTAGTAAIAITGAAVTVGGFVSGDLVSLDASGHPVDSGTALSTVTGHIADASIHFTQAAISITASQVSDFAIAVNAEVAEPANQIVFGTGTDIDSATSLTYNSTSGGFSVNGAFAAVAAPGDIVLNAAASSGVADGGDVSVQGGDSVGGQGGSVVVAVGTGATNGTIQLAANYTLQIGTDLQINSDPGATGELLSSNGAAATPSWKTLAEVPHPRTTQAAPYPIVATDEVVLMTGTGNATLPVPTDGKLVVVKNIGVGVITVVPNAAETIDGGPNFGLPVQYDSVTVVSDGTNWFVI